VTAALLEQPSDEIVRPIDRQIDSTVLGLNLYVSTNALSELTVDRRLIADEQLCIFSTLTWANLQTYLSHDFLLGCTTNVVLVL
jgi:hypothetical protein